jgi:uncharacterized membrane protein YidH (DUF202 family)
MKSWIDILLWVVGLLAAGFALYEFARFATARDPATGNPDMWSGSNHLYTAVGALIVAVVCVVWAFVRRPHVEEEIHITDR